VERVIKKRRRLLNRQRPTFTKAAGGYATNPIGIGEGELEGKLSAERVANNVEDIVVERRTQVSCKAGQRVRGRIMWLLRSPVST
jgi:hypothetical protein